MWDRIKNFFLGKRNDDTLVESSGGTSTSPPGPKSTYPPIPVIPEDAPDNPFRVAILDVQPVTQYWLSASENPQCAQNAVSFRNDDGTSFIGVEPSIKKVTAAMLRFPVEPILLDGALYLPTEMEHKWAIYYHRSKIIFIRSWTREVKVLVDTAISNGQMELKMIHGVFTDSEESPELTVRIADFLIRTLALNMGELAPISEALFSQPQAAALWCMTTYGNCAKFATASPYIPPRTIPHPLRTNSLFHMAISRGNRQVIDQYLADGVSFDLLSQDGFPPLHWALERKENDILIYLLERGSPIDVQSIGGATALMLAVQAGSIERTRLLLEHGADPNALDHRGFTALHRACEIGKVEIAKLLLAQGARKEISAQGLTPRDLAMKRNERTMVELLDVKQI